MTTEELYEKIDNKFNVVINGLEKKMDNRFDKIENRLNKVENRLDKVENGLNKVENRLDKVENRLDKVENTVDNIHIKVQDLRDDMNANFKKINDKLDGVTNSNIAQILSNQTKFKNQINNKTTYNELEHKKFDCRITELELQRKYL